MNVPCKQLCEIGSVNQRSEFSWCLQYRNCQKGRTETQVAVGGSENELPPLIPTLLHDSVLVARAICL